MRSFATLMIAASIALGAFFALGRATAQFRYDLVAVASPAPALDAGVELPQLAQR